MTNASLHERVMLLLDKQSAALTDGFTSPFDEFFSNVDETILTLMDLKEAAASVTADAQREFKARIEEIVSKWTSNDSIRLHAGEMTAAELRSVRAVTQAILKEVRAL